MGQIMLPKTTTKVRKRTVGMSVVLLGVGLLTLCTADSSPDTHPTAPVSRVRILLHKTEKAWPLGTVEMQDESSDGHHRLQQHLTTEEKAANGKFGMKGVASTRRSLALIPAPPASIPKSPIEMTSKPSPP